MKTVNENRIKLVNIYTGDIVVTENYNDVQLIEDIEFIRVYNESDPKRTFLVNRKSFRKTDK